MTGTEHAAWLGSPHENRLVVAARKSGRDAAGRHEIGERAAAREELSGSRRRQQAARAFENLRPETDVAPLVFHDDAHGVAGAEIGDAAVQFRLDDLEILIAAGAELVPLWNTSS